MHLLRSHVCNDGNHTKTSHCHNRNSLVIISGVQIDFPIRQCHQLHNLAEIAAGFLDSDDIRNLPNQSRHRFREQIDAGSGRDIVHQYRNSLSGFGYRAEMLIQALLCALVVIGSNHKRCIRAISANRLGQICCCLCAVGAGSCNDRNSVLHIVHGKAAHLQMLLLAHRCRFACGSAHHNGIGSVLNLKIK